MRSDAMASSFFMRMNQQSRMDRAQGGQQPAAAQGFGSGEAQQGDHGAAFKNVYLQVAQSNERASSTPTATVGVSAEAKETAESDAGSALVDRIVQCIGEQPQQPEVTLPEGVLPFALIQNVSGEMPDCAEQVPLSLISSGVTGGETAAQPVPAGALAAQAAEASSLISSALAEIAEALNLTIDPGLEQLSIGGNAKDLTQQFSEILATLKMIAGVLDDAVAKNQSLCLENGQTVDVAQARELASFVQVRTFRIEIACAMLGISEQVQAECMQKLAGTAGSGIALAVDPSTRSMPQVHLDKLVGKLFEEPSSNLGALVAKIRALNAAGGGDAAAMVKVTVSTTTLTQEVQAAVVPASGVLDSQVMRKLLKIDVPEQVADENALAATQAVKTGLSQIVVAPSLGNLTTDAVKTADELMPVGDVGARTALGHLTGGFEAKAALPAFRGGDEAVMQQIADRLQHAIRSGLNEIRLQLRPESLGEVKMRIRVEGDVVFARIHVESQQIKQIVETNLQSLKESLMQQHLSCGSLEVSVGNEGWEREDPTLRARHHGENGGSDASVESVDGAVSESGTMAIGAETGRRFGDNTVEYFA